ncbi:MAG TPA: hypothetical protein VG897_13670 [Terriglobales bacterium]|nr:hypothetical protein [Terriglobales bacterium]
MKASRSSGSARHTERVGPGPVAGAGEYPAKGPGKSKETRGRMPAEAYPSRKTPDAQKSVPNRTRGREESM